MGYAYSFVGRVLKIRKSGRAKASQRQRRRHSTKRAVTIPIPILRLHRPIQHRAESLAHRGQQEFIEQLTTNTRQMKFVPIFLDQTMG